MAAPSYHLNILLVASLSSALLLLSMQHVSTHTQEKGLLRTLPHRNSLLCDNLSDAQALSQYFRKISLLLLPNDAGESRT